MLTTIDNPYDPFTQFMRWFLFDVEKGYNSAGMLDRVARTSNEYSDEEYDRSVEAAIDEIIKFDMTNMRKKVCRIQ